MNTATEIELRFYEMLVAGRHQIKVAMLIARTFKGQEIPDDALINEALDLLVRREDIEVLGPYNRWRRSEIKKNAVVAWG